MVQYYWNPGFQQQLPQFQPQFQQPNQFPSGTPPQATLPNNGRPPFVEQSYIENILRLNRGKPGVFHFSFEHAVEAGKNTLAIPGIVEAAGRDHVILSTASGKRYLMPMIYFDYAEFNEELNYFNQQT
ncbi:spore coat protein GerQ [Sporosarcina sp. FSL W8-0480]|uniref:spore coat protein GerQ n=1 Tax=Sporosarcina sp. FSL W8-0480 TaxID=2954701 RepID=UPI0030DB569F